MSRKYTTNTTGLKRQIIESLARNDLNISEVARELHYNRNTIEYHIVNVEKETGLSPIRFYDLIELLKSYPAGNACGGATT